jgi:H+-translocating NAD(P) transhydrogenase subunit beta
MGFYPRYSHVSSPTFDRADAALIIGANNVFNPDARRSTGSPFAGMPILDADRVKTVFLVKRSLGTGFATGNTLMLLENGRKAVAEITAALDEEAWEPPDTSPPLRLSAGKGR